MAGSVYRQILLFWRLDGQPPSVAGSTLIKLLYELESVTCGQRAVKNWTDGGLIVLVVQGARKPRRISGMYAHACCVR